MNNKKQTVSPHRRHRDRRGCCYCGVTLRGPTCLAHKEQPDEDRRTWDHVVPASCGGKIQVPACSWCNSTKGSRSLSEFLSSSLLRVRRSGVALRDADADPMQEKILLQMRDEDMTRIRREVEYHSR